MLKSSRRGSNMKVFSYIYVVMLPYLIIGAVLGIVSLFDGEIGKGAIIAILIAIFVLCSVGVCACIMCNIVSLAGFGETHSAVRNLVIKLSHIPAHLLVLVIVGGFMNPFLFLVSWVPALFGVALLCFDACANICGCVSLALRKKTRFLNVVLLCVGSFIYVVDIICAVIQIIISKKTDTFE